MIPTAGRDDPSAANEDPHSRWITFAAFRAACEATESRCAAIRAKYPELKAYLVVSSPIGQTSSDSGVAEIVREFPPLLADNGAKDRAMVLTQTLADTKKLAEKIRIHEELKTLADGLLVDGDCRFELRFGHLHYQSIAALQQDELVDRTLTPTTAASIRIVLGQVRDFIGGDPSR